MDNWNAQPFDHQDYDMLKKCRTLLLPMHIVFLKLRVDPSCSPIFEAEEAEAGVMRRPPRDSRVRHGDPRQPLVRFKTSDSAAGSEI